MQPSDEQVIADLKEVDPIAIGKASSATSSACEEEQAVADDTLGDGRAIPNKKKSRAVKKKRPSTASIKKEEEEDEEEEEEEEDEEEERQPIELPASAAAVATYPPEVSKEEGKWPAMSSNVLDDEDQAIEVQEQPATMIMICLLALSFLIPQVILLCMFSHIGNGLDFYNAVAPTIYNSVGSILIVMAFLVFIGYYICDWPNWRHKRAKLGALLLPAMLLLAACGLKARAYPFLPVVLTIATTPILCGFLRIVPYRNVKRGAFFMAYANLSVLAVVGLLCLWCGWIIRGNEWDSSLKLKMATSSAKLFEIYTVSDTRIGQDRSLLYEQDCGPEKNLEGFSSEAKSDIGEYCKKTMTVLFTCWSCPLPSALSNIFLGIVACINGYLLDLDGNDSVARLDMMIKSYLLLLSIIFMGMYLSSSISGASIYLGKTLLAFFMAAMSILVGGMYVEVGKKRFQGNLDRSPMIKMLVQACKTDWAKAIFIGGLNIWLPIFLLCDRARMIFSQRSIPVTDRKLFSPMGTTLVDEHLIKWNWASILVKICLLGELFFVFQVGVAKATYIFLSWLNGLLASVDYAVVILLIFVIGYIMFLLPPVPGVPVYVFCGIVVAEQGRQLESVGFFWGCVLACLLAWVLKLAACMGQYGIGFCAGKSIKVQQLIGVDKVPTRALEKILRANGLTVGKVSVLVGGPDWPTSVTCGILKLSIPQMLLGTAPVFFVSSPCVLAGAFLARVTLGEESIWSALANGFLVMSAIAQMMSMILAVACITKVVDADFSELSKPRKEHEAVEALTKQEAAYLIKYEEVTDFCQSTLLFRWKLVISIGASLQLLSGFLFAFGADYCFRPFAVSSDISAPYEENGLNGSAFNIILPMGWIASGCFFAGVACHLIFVKVASRLTEAEMNVEKRGEAVDPERPTKAAISSMEVPLADHRHEVVLERNPTMEHNATPKHEDA